MQLLFFALCVVAQISAIAAVCKFYYYCLILNQLQTFSPFFRLPPPHYGSRAQRQNHQSSRKKLRGF
ncbi:hypothetical protein Y032_1006g3373 [Ancylostoma ceylanicum]|uniref:Uncharacterized protein n=1 Tax=Ancylostoma ceylanicum TaxID=53326 RepID=A0A016W8N4_9BILA|nr:hypothetical protein Y032_1006g3373 [Ancylostoma ceylanicum]